MRFVISMPWKSRVTLTVEDPITLADFKQIIEHISNFVGSQQYGVILVANNMFRHNVAEYIAAFTQYVFQVQIIVQVWVDLSRTDQTQFFQQIQAEQVVA